MKKIVTISFLFGLLIASVPSYANDISDAHICRAGISAIWNQKIEDVTVDKIQKNIIHVSFPPKSSGTSSAFKCVVNGNKIAWATSFGNWRDTDLDSVVNYDIKDNVLFVKENHKNGSVFTKRFNASDLMAE